MIANTKFETVWCYGVPNKPSPVNRHDVLILGVAIKNNGIKLVETVRNIITQGINIISGNKYVMIILQLNILYLI